MSKAIYSQLVILFLCTSLQAKQPANVVLILADDLHVHKAYVMEPSIIQVRSGGVESFWVPNATMKSTLNAFIRGWNDVGFHGSVIKTPNINRLALEGVILDNYYVQPLCTPTRGTLLTGRYPIHTGLQHKVIVGSQPYGLPLTEVTLAQRLKTLDYSTHIVGKWHLGFCQKEFLPEKRGFDSHLGIYLGLGDYFKYITIDGGFEGYDLHENGQALWNMTDIYSTEIFTDRADTIIRKHNQSKPLFLYLAHQAVHAGNNDDPIQVPQKYVDRFPYIKDLKRRKYAGMVAALDDSVGVVYQALQESGMLNNTLIIFSTDNGAPSSAVEGIPSSNWPLRGTKSTLWQGGVRGVGFVHSPLLKEKAYVNKNLIHVADWLPTIYNLAGGNLSDILNIDGIDQWHVLSNNATTNRSEVLLNIDPVWKTEAIIVGDYKIISREVSDNLYDSWHQSSELSQSSDNLDNLIYDKEVYSRKILVKCGLKPENASQNCQPYNEACLFNIKDDPCEYNNLAPLLPDIVAKLKERLNFYRSTMIPPGNKPIDPAGNPQLHGGVWQPWL